MWSLLVHLKACMKRVWMYYVLSLLHSLWSSLEVMFWQGKKACLMSWALWVSSIGLNSLLPFKGFGGTRSVPLISQPVGSPQWKGDWLWKCRVTGLTAGRHSLTVEGWLLFPPFPPNVCFSPDWWETLRLMIGAHWAVILLGCVDRQYWNGGWSYWATVSITSWRSSVKFLLDMY